MTRHENDTKEWGALGSQALTPITMSYEPLINIRTVQEESTRTGAQMEVETSGSGMDIDREDQGVRIDVRTGEGADRWEGVKER